MSFGLFNKTMTMSPYIDIYIIHNLYLLQKKEGNVFLSIVSMHRATFERYLLKFYTGPVILEYIYTYIMYKVLWY